MKKIFMLLATILLTAFVSCSGAGSGDGGVDMNDEEVFTLTNLTQLDESGITFNDGYTIINTHNNVNINLAWRLMLKHNSEVCIGVTRNSDDTGLYAYPCPSGKVFCYKNDTLKQVKIVGIDTTNPPAQLTISEIDNYTVTHTLTW